MSLKKLSTFIYKLLSKANSKIITLQVVHRDLPSRKNIFKRITGIHSPTTLNNKTSKCQFATNCYSNSMPLLSLKHCVYNMHLYTQMDT